MARERRCPTATVIVRQAQLGQQVGMLEKKVRSCAQKLDHEIVGCLVA